MRYILILSFILCCSSKTQELQICEGNWDEINACKADNEQLLLNEFPNKFHRESNTLFLKNDKDVNPTKQLKSENYNSYRLLKYFPSHNISLIEATGFEYYESFIYHHKYGSFKTALGDIQISPNGKYLFGFNRDLEAEFSPNGVVIYRISDWFNLSSSFYPTTFGIESVEFLSDNEVKLKTFFWLSDFKAQYGECYMQLVNTIWQFKTLDCNSIKSKANKPLK